MSRKRRLAVVVSHPIQYYVPLYRALARDAAIEIHVLFASRIGLTKTYDSEMKADVAWATDLTGGYSHEFLPEGDAIQHVGFRAVDNPSVTRALARFRPDAVIIHGYALMTMLRALAWCRLRGVRTIMASDSSSHGSPSGWRHTVKMSIMPLLLRQFGAALTMSDRSEEHLAGMGYPRDRMFRAPTMIDEGFWRARETRAATRAAQRAALGLADDEFTLLCSGKLHPRKRVQDLLDALLRLKADGKPPTLLIAGDGEQREILEAFARQHGLAAHFLGFVNIDALPDLNAAADAFVHAAEVEQYGMVVLEAAVVGLPMVLSDAVGAIGPTSIARPGVNAIVYPCADVAALAAGIAKLRDDVDMRRAMAGASLTISNDHAGPTSVAAVISAMGE